jgi:hypothetical protein
MTTSPCKTAHGGAGKLLLPLSLAVLLGCSGQRESGVQDDELIGNFLPPTNEGVAFDVPSHSTGEYRLLRWSRLPNGNIDALQRQDSRYGTIISRMEIDCSARRYRVLGEGENEEEARRNRANAGPMSDLVEGSIRDVTVNVACREARR